MPAFLDPRLRLLSALGLWPGQSMDHYLALTGLTRVSFLRAWRELAAENVVSDRGGQAQLHGAAAASFLERLYPGLSAAVKPAPAGVATVTMVRAEQRDASGFDDMMGLAVEPDRSCQQPVARVLAVPVPPNPGAASLPLAQAGHVWGRAAVIPARQTG